MLQVSEMLEVARRGRVGEALAAAAPDRFRRGAERPPVVVWNVCGHCNLACPHCYAAAARRPAPEAGATGELSTDEGLRLLDELAAIGVRVVIFSGGEPLLRADLPKLLERAARLGMAAHLSSNGVLIDEARAAVLAAAGVAYVGVSIDGPPSFNDAYRGLSGAFDAALRGLRHVRAAGLRTGLRLTLTRRNQEHLEAVARIAEDVGAERFYVSHLIRAGRARALGAQDLDRSEARAALERLFVLAEAGLGRVGSPRIVTGANDSDGPFLLRWIAARHGAAAALPVAELLRRRGGNSVGEAIIDIDERGRVHPDPFWRTALLGDLRRQSVAEVLRHPLRAELRRREIHLTGRCRDCAYLDLCRGSHRERAEAACGDRWAPDPACVLTDREIGLAGAAAEVA